MLCLQVVRNSPHTPDPHVLQPHLGVWFTELWQDLEDLPRLGFRNDQRQCLTLDILLTTTRLSLLLITKPTAWMELFS